MRRDLVRRLLAAPAGVLVLPFLAWHRLQCLVVPADRSLQSVSQGLSLLPDGLGTFVRAAFYRRVLDAVGPGCVVSFGVVFSKTGSRLGRDVYLGRATSVGLVDLGDDVLVGDAVQLLSGSRQHGSADVDVPIREQHGEFTRISVGAGTWVGSGAVLMADVGAHCIVGAGAVVTRPVPDYAVVAGNPAVPVRDRRAGSTGAPPA